MAVDPKDISQEEYNERVSEWGTRLGVKIRASIQMLTSKGKKDLLKSLRLKTAKWFGEVDKLSYHFDRHGVFVHKGVGRGYVMIGGNVHKVKGYQTKASILRMGKRLGRSWVNESPKSGAELLRNPKPWFNPVVEQNINGLADLVAEMNADKVVNATKILIR